MTTATTLSRPQPIGLFPFPASNLLLPGSELVDTEAVRTQLLNGILPEEIPADWRFFQLACQGNLAEAIELLRTQPDNDIKAYNLFVLDPSPDQYRSLKPLWENEHPELSQLLDLAAFSNGLLDQLPETFELDRELQAWAMTIAAAASLENGDHQAATEQLQAGIEAAKGTSAILAAELTGQLADVNQQYQLVAGPLLVQAYRSAIQIAETTGRESLIADLYVKLGMLMQNMAGNSRGALLEAVNAYQTALHHGITEQDRPYEFATLQNNLGLAYLSMPAIESSNHIRTGIAVQSFRHALRIFQRDEHPDMWATINMNLANAFQYAPSSHPEENLIQAVEIYDQVLEVRTRERDPVAYATVLSNQANALAHLGMFKPALEKIAEAYKLFQWYDMEEPAVAARELVEQINSRIEDRQSENATAAQSETDGSQEAATAKNILVDDNTAG